MAGDFLEFVGAFFVCFDFFDFLIVVVGALLDFIVCFGVVGGEETMSLALFAEGQELPRSPGGGDGVRDPRDDRGDESALVEESISGWC